MLPLKCIFIRKIDMDVRISGGFLKGRRITGGPSGPFRPTTDRNRQMVFNILGTDVSNSSFLDLYSGSGAVGLEALSRGAGHVTFIDNDFGAVRCLEQCIYALGQSKSCRIICDDAAVLSKLSGLPNVYSLIFLDPPYDFFPVPNMLQISELLSPGGILIFEHASRHKPKGVPNLSLLFERNAGESMFTFFRKDAS